MTDYNLLSQDTKVWIFQANRELSAKECNSIIVELQAFVNNWISHGSLLKAHFKLLNNRFIIFFADEEGDRMCGRAIDASVRFVKELESKYSLSLLDRHRIAYKAGDAIRDCSMEEFTALYEKGIITDDTLVFNNLVVSKNEFENNWMIPLSLSWHNSYIMQHKE